MTSLPDYEMIARSLEPMAQAAASMAIREYGNQQDTPILTELARLDERLKNIERSTGKSWLNYWAPLAFVLAALAAIYLRFDDKIRALELVDQASVIERAEMKRRLDRIEGKQEGNGG